MLRSSVGLHGKESAQPIHPKSARSWNKSGVNGGPLMTFSRDVVDIRIHVESENGHAKRRFYDQHEHDLRSAGHQFPTTEPG
jgi:hypothetical protein